MLINLKQKKIGMSLVETLLALGVLTATAVALTGIIVQINAFTNYAKWRNNAVSLAQESLEKIRAYYQTNGFAALQIKSGSTASPICYTDATLTTTCSCSTNCELISTNSIFRRKVSLSFASGQITVKSYITWNEKNSPRTMEVDSYFYNYK